MKTAFQLLISDVGSASLPITYILKRKKSLQLMESGKQKYDLKNNFSNPNQTTSAVPASLNCAGRVK